MISDSALELVRFLENASGASLWDIAKTFNYKAHSGVERIIKKWKEEQSENKG